jgi:aryl-alcohol dehydrogenase-like predicted oxidoreductase
MKKNEISRRKFIKNTAAISAGIAISSRLGVAAAKSSFDAKGIPTRMLGKTGIEIPIMIIGTGSRFMSTSTDKGLEILEYALNQGLFYWDTAASYKNDYESSEERLGRLLKSRRKEVFLATKVHERKADDAKRIIERSLNRLQTDYIDLLQVHSIKDEKDVQSFIDEDGVLPVLKEYQDQGIVKHIGFTGHTSAKAMKLAAEKYDFDTMLIAMNHQSKGAQRFEEQAVPAAGNKGMGVLAMKVIRPRETVAGLDPKEMIRYALTLKHITSAVVGTDSMDVLKTNLDVIQNFKPLPQDKMEELEVKLTPFYNHRNLAWMQPGYVDGQFA